MIMFDQSFVQELADQAIKAAEYAYVPYSHFHVGAAVLCSDDSVYTGCNIENASFGLTNCAERTAIFKAVSEGKREFKAIAVYGCMEGKEADSYAYPCGSCRQVMAEFACSKEMPIILVKSREVYKIVTLEDLLPYSFSL